MPTLRWGRLACNTLVLLRGSAYARRRREREVEMENDERDRHREKEDLEELRLQVSRSGWP